MKYRYVVIEREYGSGGTEIGKLLSEKTDIPCYGSEILNSISEKLQIPVSEMQRYEESVTGSLLYSLYVLSKMNDGSADMLSREDQIFLEEQRLIKEYALKGSAIFIGRCAASALPPEHTLTVFIHADDAYRKQRIIQEYGVAENAAYNTMTKYDKKRKHYYTANTGKEWKDWNNYHIVLDSGKLGTELCADMIQSALT